MNQAQKLGGLFRSKRLEMNLSLKEVENVTSIRMNYLKAIEDGEWNRVIPPVYAQGFFKQFAQYLGLDGEAILQDHSSLFNDSSNQDFAYGIGTLEVRSAPGSGVKWIPNAAWIGISAAILVAAWYSAKYLGVL
jgi:cytoskeletal protein RodZ